MLKLTLFKILCYCKFTFLFKFIHIKNYNLREILVYILCLSNLDYEFLKSCEIQKLKLEKHKSVTSTLIMKKPLNNIYFGLNDGNIVNLNMNCKDVSLNIIEELSTGYNNPIRSMKNISNVNILAGNSFGILFLLRINDEGKTIITNHIRIHYDNINCIMNFSDDFAITGSSDCFLKVISKSRLINLSFEKKILETNLKESFISDIVKLKSLTYSTYSLKKISSDEFISGSSLDGMLTQWKLCRIDYLVKSKSNKDEFDFSLIKVKIYHLGCSIILNIINLDDNYFVSHSSKELGSIHVWVKTKYVDGFLMNIQVIKDQITNYVFKAI